MTRLALSLVACLMSTLAAQPPQDPSPSGEGGGTSGQAQAAKPAVPADAASAPKARSPEMQVSQTDAAAGESERNENVAVAPVDLNILKDLLVRIGTTATIIPQFLPDFGYFGSEYGVAPAIGLHVPARARRALHGRLYDSSSTP